MNNSGIAFSISFGNKTDTGKQREKNEDYLETFKSTFGDVFIVCDGMGGHLGGEVASRLAIASAKNVILQNPQRITATKDIIKAAIREANINVFKRSKEDPNLKGMGTTIVIAIVNNGILYYGHVGDSRLYIVRGSRIFQLTHDHSFVQTLVDKGLITDDEAENHPRKNEITRALGIAEAVIPDISEKGLMLYKGDKLILCTDGLSNMVSDRDIYEVVKETTPLEAADKLIDMANMAGGTDNITLQVISVDRGPALPDELKDIPPEGAVMRAQRANVDRAITRELEGNYSIGTPVKKSNKKLLYILSGASLLIIIFAALLIIDPMNLFKKEKTYKPIPETESMRVDIMGNLENILRDIYNNPNSKLDSSKFINVEFTYKGEGFQQPKNYTWDSLKNNINKSQLKFNRIEKINDTTYRYWAENKNATYEYEIKSTMIEGKIKFYSIEFKSKSSNNPEEKNPKIKKQPEVNKPRTPSRDNASQTKQNEKPKEQQQNNEQPKQDKTKEKIKTEK